MSREISVHDKTPSAVVAIKMHLQEQICELAKACPEGMKPDRLIQIAGIICYRTPKLQQCDKASILLSVTQAASLGLDLSPGLAEGYLIPRWNKETRAQECTFVPSYQGLAKLARNAGSLRYLIAKIVHQNDSFETWNDPEPNLKHVECRNGDPGPMTWVYAVAKLPTGEILYEVMSRTEVESIRDRSESWKKEPGTGPWATDFNEMAKKTVIKRLCKMLPRSPELAKAIDLDNMEYQPNSIEPPQNHTGYGRGQYASPDQTKTYLEAMEKFVNERNARWLDRWHDWHDHGEIAKDIGELCNRWQADNHLVKWAKEKGLIKVDPATDESGVKNRQIGRYTAVIYHRSLQDRAALANELSRYLDELEAKQTEKILAKNEDLSDDEFEGITDDVKAIESDNSDVWHPGRE